MHSKIVNNTRYDELGKLMKQTNFTVKNLGGLPKKSIHYSKKKFNIMHSKIVNNTRYDELWKLMKQTNFTVKNLGVTSKKINPL